MKINTGETWEVATAGHRVVAHPCNTSRAYSTNCVVLPDTAGICDVEMQLFGVLLIHTSPYPNPFKACTPA